MRLYKSKKLDLIIIKPNFFTDKRGKFIESFSKKLYFNKLNINFVEDDFCINNKNVFRGIHGDYKTWKLVSCIHGSIDSYIVNCKKKSPDFGKWEMFKLNSKNYYQVLVPPGYGNAYLIKQTGSIYHYKQSNYYSGAKNQFTYKFNDPRINLKINTKNIILSERDK